MNGEVWVYLASLALFGIAIWFGDLFYRHRAEFKSASRLVMVGFWAMEAVLFGVALCLLIDNLFGAGAWSLTR